MYVMVVVQELSTKGISGENSHKERGFANFLPFAGFSFFLLIKKILKIPNIILIIKHDLQKHNEK